jgi:hypothetical protein
MGEKRDVDRKLNKLFSENNFGFAKDESIVLGKNSENSAHNEALDQSQAVLLDRFR